MSAKRIIGTLCLLLSFPAGGTGIACAQADPTAELDRLVTAADKEDLLRELGRVAPPERLRDLAAYGARQAAWGGGFYGMLPDQLAEPDSIPVPAGAAGRLDAALRLARQRRENLVALARINPDYPVAFRGDSLAGFLAGLERDAPAAGGGASSRRLHLDVSALGGFLTALADAEVTGTEAEALAALPSNQAMLRHRRDLGYVPAPLPDTASLAAMIRLAGSLDPLDRLWCWINPQNAFDYADVVGNAAGYRRLLDDLESHGEALAAAVLQRVGAYAPPDAMLETTFALTVGWAIRGWTTPEMAGLNIEHVKDDWGFLFGTVVEETYHRLQLDLLPSATGAPARDFVDLTAIATGAPRYDRLFEIVTYTVAEGAANLVRGPFTTADVAEQAPAGAELMARFVRQVVVAGDPAGADALINEGLRSNGPLYGLGRELARRIAERDGKRAVGEYQRRGPVPFFLHGAELAVAAGEPLLAAEVVAAVDSLGQLVANLAR